jgi:hypothetical protein
VSLFLGNHHNAGGSVRALKENCAIYIDPLVFWELRPGLKKKKLLERVLLSPFSNLIQIELLGITVTKLWRALASLVY